MKYNSFLKILLFGLVCAFIATSCVKEGPQGEPGVDGKDGVAGAAGKDGKDANETCKMCHTPEKVEAVATQFELSKHNFGEVAFEETGVVGCAPCHESEGFKYVIANNIPATFTIPAGGTKFANNYSATPNTSYGEITCNTCHSSIHATYTSADLPALTTTAKVPMTMWGAKKEINITADGGTSNLCIRCHQPRPLTNLQTGDVLDYPALASNPKGIAYDANNNSATTNIIRPSYRMHIHYGAIGAVYAGVGGVEFGTGYTSSAHPSVASCGDCHMGDVVGSAGGHSFKAEGNLTTCNATGCHSTPITASSTTFWTVPRAEIKTLLADLAAKLTVDGVEIMNRNGDATTNLWYGHTTNNYDGYINIMDMQNNPSGSIYNAKQFQNPSAPTAPNQYWSQADIDLNKTLPKLSLTNAQLGAIINFQLCLREYSLGIHNFAYTKALLTNSKAVL
jgi:hypothetical protein